jgi:hypothetical protein
MLYERLTVIADHGHRQKKFEKAELSSYQSSMTTTIMSSSSSTGSSGKGGFWKKSSSAIPGRPNPSNAQRQMSGNDHAAVLVAGHSGHYVPPVAGSNESRAASSFKVFEQSVSDAWDCRDLEATRPADMVEIAISHQQPPLAARSIENRANQTDAKEAAAASVVDLSRCNNSKLAKVEALVASASIEIEDLRKLSWPGLSPKARAKAWKMLCGYVPGNAARQHEVIQRKQEEYQRYVDQYFATKDQDVHQDTYRQIHIDIPRMSPVVGLFQQRCVQEIFERILYIWAIRHPASGYVQGINDLVTPFFLVFLRDGLEALGDGSSNVDDPSSSNVVPADLEVELLPLELRNSVEADSFWCLTVVLDGIQDNYTFAQPGIQVKVKQLEELIQRIDDELHTHLVSNEVSYLQFSFRWMNNLLMRELPVKASIRLWDTYLSQANGFSHFHLYVCAAFLIHWKSELLKKQDFHTLLMFLQNLPTAKWGDQEINMLVAEAYRLSYLFADAPSHLGRKPPATS